MINKFVRLSISSTFPNVFTSFPLPKILFKVMEIQDIPENKHDIFIFGGLGSRSKNTF